MKKTCTTIATALLMLVSFSSFAANPLKNAEARFVLSTYIDAVTLGTDAYSKYLLTDDFEYKNTANQDAHNRRAFLRFLKENKGYQSSAVTTHEILDLSGKSCVAKATMTFQDFTRVDHITLSNTKDGWKVSKIVTTYP